MFQGRLREFIQEGLTRGSQYLPMIQKVFRAEGLPLDLAYIPLIESAFKPNALSRAKAKGVWQFMRGTGLENGLRADWYIDERSDPEKATVAAARYLTTLSSMFEGDWHLALASYNGGPGRVQRAMKRGRQTDFWKLSSRSGLLPRETREYVPMILAAIVIARNPAQYGFVFDPLVPPSIRDRHPRRPGRPAARGRVGRHDHRRDPDAQPGAAPLDDAGQGYGVLAAGAVGNWRGHQPAPGGVVERRPGIAAGYTVRKGETLAAVARKLKVSRTDLAEANYLRTSSRVSVGQQLIVPHEATVLMAARTERPVPAAESHAIVADAVVPAMSADASEMVKTHYRVRRGDTLASIARTFRTSVSLLRTWNNLPGSRIVAGSQLTIYTARAN